MRTLSTLFVAATLAATASAQDLIGVAWNGTVYRIDSVTGVGVQIGQTGYTNGSSIGHNAMAIAPDGTIWVTYSRPGTAELFRIDPTTGTATPSGVQIPVDVRGLAFSPAGTMYAVTQASTDALHTIDPITNTATLVGSTGFGGLQSLAWAAGTLYAWDLSQGLVSIDPVTGVATDVNPSQGSGSRPQFLTTDGSGNLLGGRDMLYTIDRTTGIDTPIAGSGGFSDVRGADVLSVGTIYGQGCAGAGANPPQLGAIGNLASPGNVTLGVSGGIPNAPFAWVFGAPRLNLPLPGGCTLLAAPLVTAAASLDAQGRASLALVIGPGFGGVVLDTQVVVADLGSAAIPLRTSAGLELTIR